LVIISILIALPLAYLLASNWLSQFAYKISLHVGYFVVAGLAALVITLVTVGGQAIKAATKNPINALREE
jgi:ABC-type antimicrobial peptide transport system permease subunit